MMYLIKKINIIGIYLTDFYGNLLYGTFLNKRITYVSFSHFN